MKTLIEEKTEQIVNSILEFPSVEKCHFHKNGCFYVYLKSEKNCGVPNGFFNYLNRFGITIHRFDMEGNQPRLTFDCQ